MSDLEHGYLDPELLPVEQLRDAYAEALAEFGSAALAYGDNRGVLALRSALAARAVAADHHPCGSDQVVITAGTSYALHLIGTILAAPGHTVLVDQVSYDLGRRIFIDCGLRVREVPMDASGMDPGALHDALATEGPRVALIYLSPTFHNPTGLVVPTERRQELLAVAARHGVLVVEDDAYAELNLDQIATPRSLAGLARYHGVIRLCTFSKTLAPGLRLGWLLAEPAVTSRLITKGLFASGGSLNHTASLAATVMVRSGAYDRHLGQLRAQLRARRDALAGVLRPRLGEDIDFTLPAGGYFLWLRSRGQHTESSLLLAAATKAGVRIATGSRFGTTLNACVRLAYSFHSPSDLAATADRLATAWTVNPPDPNRSSP